MDKNLLISGAWTVEKSLCFYASIFLKIFVFLLQVILANIRRIKACQFCLGFFLNFSKFEKKTNFGNQYLDFWIFWQTLKLRSLLEIT